MKSKVQKKAINLLLAVSMLGMVSGSYISTAYAEGNSNVNQENPRTNTLANLEITGIKLDQPFSSDVKEYSATVENDVQTFKLLVEGSNPASSIFINGQTVTSGKEETFSLQTGINTFLITVSDGSQTANTYTLTITRKQSANNLLQTITLSAGALSPAFSSAITDYTVQVTNDVNAIMITPTAIDKTATIAVNGTLVKGAGVSVKLPDGKTDIIIVVTAENGDKRTYTLHVTKAADTSSTPNNSSQNNNSSKNNNFLPNNNSSQNSRDNSFLPTGQQQNAATEQKTSKATLSSLTVSNGTWGKDFSKNKFTYHVAVSNDVKTLTINPTASYNASTIMINGDSSKTIQLEDDKKTIIPIVVTYDDGDRKTYVLVFDRDE
ncbi:cadherin-like beta sandwich domain-containing protein [Neobacillus novalis]|uniref:Cadherin-like beta sandwich domain-containing protein n=1 Tax=Neobacillus novalis TaxID=220687 RepID=A0AA95MQU7_9BACI|nr:cadherin-like beta sandwich domain-containing protein [Neobacillus novalis]WHY88306.1 cadherin-like beta sandwich domain-containing protein [Neobacillus novalis]